MAMAIPYTGKAEYCYANSTAMLLSLIGEEISPGRIEVLTGVGLGAFLDPTRGNLMFSGFSAAPDAGISRALRLLGFEFVYSGSEDASAPPVTELKEALERNPVALGPVDIGLLTYNPNSKGATGADHFVVSYGFEDDRFYVNDPIGIPLAWLTEAELVEAWRADAIGYKAAHYQYWTEPRRVRTPSDQEVCHSAMAEFAELYRSSAVEAEHAGVLTGPEAIRSLSNSVRQGEVSDDQIRFLTRFMLPVSAARALDYASFFRPNHADLNALKTTQAELFGDAQVRAVRGNLSALTGDLNRLAEVESEIARLVMSA